MMIDEAGGKITEEFVGLKAKLYSYKILEGKEEKHYKGIKKAIIKKNIIHDEYRECLFSGNMEMRKVNAIRSHKHEVFMETIKKVALSANDDKRIIIEEEISNFAHGHYQLNQ